MFNFPFMLAGSGNVVMTIGLFALVIVGFYFLFIRPQKKREREAGEMRDNLRVGDEVTTIGGIVGKIVSLREETFVLETTKDKTHIRFLRAAIRSVDVRAEDSVDPTKKPTEPKTGKGKKKGKKPANTTSPATTETDNTSIDALIKEASDADAATEPVDTIEVSDKTNA